MLNGRVLGAILGVFALFAAASHVGCSSNPTPPAGGCTSNNECDDGDACTTDACINGACTNTPECTSNVACNDDNACTTDVCVDGCCEHTPECAADADCDDEDADTVDTCLDGCCQYESIVVECPSPQDTFATMIPASYAIVIHYENGPNPDDRVDMFTGTAFAVGENELATNAHVAEFVLDNPLPVEAVFAIQSGTGDVLTLSGTVVHPDYTGTPFSSPDVGLFFTEGTLPNQLEIATESEVADLAVGDTVGLTGFPGDVQDVFEIEVGVTVPQATSLSGTITALRSFDPTALVTPGTTDVVQHQLPTTPGTSGSPLVRCGKVVALNNSGTLNLILTFDEEGNLVPDRQAAAANNFGIHAKHLIGLQSDVEQGLVSSVPLPPPDPSYAGTFAGAAISATTGLVTHDFAFTIDENRSISGLSFWSNATLILSGTVDRYGYVALTDNGVSFRFVPIAYFGYVSIQTGEIVGLYLEGDTRAGLWYGTLE